MHMYTIVRHYYLSACDGSLCGFVSPVPILYRYLGAKVYTNWVHGPIGFAGFTKIPFRV